MGVNMRGDRPLALSKRDKENYLTGELGIPQETIQEILGIKNKRERLLRAMQVAAEYEENPRSATALALAGYSGESPIVHYFGSSHNLRVKAGVYKGSMDTCSWPGVEFSQADLRRSIRIPDVITMEVAELVGIHIGDGYQRASNDFYEIEVVGSDVDERQYIDNYVVPLYERVYGIRPKPKIYERRGVYGFRIRSKAIFTFQKSLGLPVGRKISVAIPEIIMNSGELRVACLRGIADTEFCITRRRGGGKKFHPMIAVDLSSRPLVKQIEWVLKTLGFNILAYYDLEAEGCYYHALRLCGFKNLHKWMEIIGFNNPKHYTKYLFWKNLGYYPTNMTTKQRIEILEKSGMWRSSLINRMTNTDNWAGGHNSKE